MESLHTSPAHSLACALLRTAVQHKNRASLLRVLNNPLDSTRNAGKAIHFPDSLLSQKSRRPICKLPDIRLISGNTATHSDMLMWSHKEPTESAALQFLNILFSVPQISVKLDEIPADHQKMLRFWIAFWRQHRETLLDGALEPFYPEQLFPFILTKGSDEWIAAYYADVVGKMSSPLPRNFWLVNATQQTRLVMELEGDSGSYQLTTFNVLGEQVGNKAVSLSQGISSFQVPLSGLLHFHRE